MVHTQAHVRVCENQQVRGCVGRGVCICVHGSILASVCLCVFIKFWILRARESLESPSVQPSPAHPNNKPPHACTAPYSLHFPIHSLFPAPPPAALGTWLQPIRQTWQLRPPGREGGGGSTFRSQDSVSGQIPALLLPVSLPAQARTHVTRCLFKAHTHLLHYSFSPLILLLSFFILFLLWFHFPSTSLGMNESVTLTHSSPTPTHAKCLF